MDSHHSRSALTVVSAVWLAGLMALTVAMPAAQPPAQATAQGPVSLRPFSPAERRALLDKAIGADRIVAFAKGQRVRALSVVPQQIEKDGKPAVVAVAIVVNYGTGEAVRVTIDPATNDVRAVEPLKGRPQSSPEEREDAIALIRKDAEVAPLLAAGTHIVGGFVVDAPQGQPQQGRYLEFHVATTAGAAVAEVIVDLGRGRVASLRRQAPAQKGGAR